MGYTSETRESLANLSHGNTRVNGRSVRKEGVCSYSFISTWDVESWESGFEMFPHGESGRCYSPLSGAFKSLFHGISIDPTKIMFYLL